MYEYACAVRDNPGDPAQVGHDPSFLPVIYEASVDDDWTDEEVWRKANPLYDSSPTIPQVLRDELQAARDRPTYQNAFRRWYLNVRTEAETAWLSAEAWDLCTGAIPLRPNGLAEWLEAQGVRDRPCYAALDLSKTTDLTGFVLYWPESGVVVPFAWMPRATAEKAEKRDRVPYSTWARQGYLELTDGNVVDYEYVKARVLEEVGRFDVRWFGYDPWNATQMAQQLQAEGVPVVEHRQGFVSMSEPSKALERLVLGGRLVHGGHPVLRWCAQNVMVRTDPAGNVKPDKSRSTGRIDLIVALVMAIGGAISNPLRARTSLDDLLRSTDPLEIAI